MKTSLFNAGQTRALERGASADSDPALTPFVTASVEDIRHAERLRDRLRERYPNRPTLPVSYWSVGAD